MECAPLRGGSKAGCGARGHGGQSKGEGVRGCVDWNDMGMKVVGYVEVVT